MRSQAQNELQYILTNVLTSILKQNEDNLRKRMPQIIISYSISEQPMHQVTMPKGVKEQMLMSQQEIFSPYTGLKFNILLLGKKREKRLETSHGALLLLYFRCSI